MPKANETAKKQPNLYEALIDKIFFDRYKRGAKSFEFKREDMESAAAELGLRLPKNIGDVLYSFRFRKGFSERIVKTQPSGLEWRIELAGRAVYRFVLGKQNRIVPNPSLVQIKIPDATPELIRAYACDDEQALLATVRYNRLIDVFLGLTTFSLQNHMRTTVTNIGQIEIDELYVGLDSNGCHYVIPVQAKGGKDQISIVQTTQDIKLCAEKYPDIACRSVSVQFMDNDIVAMFELTVQDDEIRVVDEKHYLLVPADELDEKAIKNYRTAG